MTDQIIKNMLWIILVISMIGLTSAINVNPNPIILDSTTDSVQLTFSGVGDWNETLHLSSNLQPYSHLQFNDVNQDEVYTRIYLDDLPTSNITGFLFFGSDDVEVKIITDKEPELIVETDLIVFPTSKIVNVQQGNIKTQSITITVPSNYPRVVTFHSVDFNPEIETISFGDLNLGQVSPGESIHIPIEFSAVDAQTGTYSSQLSIYATDDVKGQLQIPSISLTLQITTGVTPFTEETFSTPPTCAISATTMNLNNTYSFTCTGVVSNLDIIIPSSDFYIGKSVDITSSLYTYTFMPIKFGEIDFIAEFRYNGASIFSPYKQNILITSAGSVIAGTDLKLVFTPALDKSTGDEDIYLIQIIDDRSGSLVENPKLFIDAIEVVPISAYTFEFPFVPEIDYSIRARADGYTDLIEKIKINVSNIDVTINPTTGDSSTIFNITSSILNATITIQNKTYLGNYFGTLPGGIIEIKVSKEGFKTQIVNVTVEDRMKIVSFGGVFEKGVAQNFTLSKEGNWVVYHKKDMSAVERTELVMGIGALIEFTPKKKGVYVIEAEGFHIGTYELEGFSFSDKYFGMKSWIWIILIVILLILVIVIMYARVHNSDLNDDGNGLNMPIGPGL